MTVLSITALHYGLRVKQTEGFELLENGENICCSLEPLYASKQASRFRTGSLRFSFSK